MSYVCMCKAFLHENTTICAYADLCIGECNVYIDTVVCVYLQMYMYRDVHVVGNCLCGYTYRYVSDLRV